MTDNKTFCTISPDLFAQIRSSKLLDKNQREVLTYIWTNQETTTHRFVTQKEIARHYDDLNRSYGNRCAELLHLGVIYKAGKKVDPVTQRSVTGYRLTGDMPCAGVVLPPVKQSPAAALKRLIRETSKLITDGQKALAEAATGEHGAIGLADCLQNALHDLLQDLQNNVDLAKDRKLAASA